MLAIIYPCTAPTIPSTPAVIAPGIPNAVANAADTLYRELIEKRNLHMAVEAYTLALEPLKEKFGTAIKTGKVILGVMESSAEMNTKAST